MIDKDKALQLLGTGLGPTEVSTTLGCDPSYISQLLMDEGFRSEVLTLRMQHLQASTRRDKEIDSIEDELLVKVRENLPYLVKWADIVRAFAIVNSAKRRGAQSAGNINVTQQIVNISLPEAARRVFTTNHEGVVVQVDEQVTTTMPLQTLLRDRIKQGKGDNNGANGQNAPQTLEGKSKAAA